MSSPVDRLNYFAVLYGALFKSSLLANIQYRASGMIWMIGSVLEPTIFLIVGSSVAESEGGTVGGYTPNEFAAYYITLMMVSHLTFSWVMQVMQFRIQFGSLSYDLMRPIHPIHADIMDNLSFKLVQMTVMIPALIVLWWLFEPDFNFTWTTTLIAAPIIVLAFLVRFMLDWTLALAAFWTTRVTAINNTYFAVSMFLSGRIAPIALLPLWLQDVSTILPFYYVIAFPVEILTGRLTGDELVDGVLALLTWLVLGGSLMLFTWRRAVRNFSAVGG